MANEHPLVQQAESLAAKFAPRSAEIEAARQLPADIAKQMGAAGFYRMFVLERVGGLEVPPAIAARVYEALARGDAASGWIAFIGATTGLALSRMTDDAVREVLATPETLITGVFAATGSADKVANGFRVNGRWQWGSGSPNADWIGGGCTLTIDGTLQTSAAGIARNHMVLFRASDVQLLDTWYTAGLRGTGSTDFEVRELLVSDALVSGYLVKNVPDAPLFRFPQFALLTHGVAAVALGIARASLQALIELAATKKRYGARATLANSPSAQLQVALAEANLRAARAFFYESIDAAWALALAGQPMSLVARRDMRLSATHAVRVAIEVVNAMFNLAGGAAVYDSSPLQRHLRDVHVAAQHITVCTGTLETAGQLLLGVEANTANF